MNPSAPHWLESSQAEMCARFVVAPVPTAPDTKVGISRAALEGGMPVNGLRHPPKGDASGWYIWAGEGGPGQAEHFFVPLHVDHLAGGCPLVLPYLALPPGWRFLVAPDYEDVWFDETLLRV